MWWVLIEENMSAGSTKEWRVSQTFPVEGDRGAARAKAEELARTHAPRHPMMPGERSVLKIGDDEWLTMVEGATVTYHFRVTVAELV